MSRLKTRMVYKYEIRTETIEFHVRMPINAEIIFVDRQRKAPCMWVLADKTYTLTQEREFYILGTGWDIPSDAVYVGTWQEPEYGLVWHLFEKVTP